MQAASWRVVSVGLLSLCLGCGGEGNGGLGGDELGDGGSGADAGSSPDMTLVPDCVGKSLPAMLGTQNRTISIGSSKRTYVLHIPPGYDPTRFTQVVFAFHGFTNQATDFTKSIGIETASDQRNFIAVIPQGSGLIPSWNAGGCCGEAQTLGTDDVGFVKQLLTSLRAEFCVDLRPVTESEYRSCFAQGGCAHPTSAGPGCNWASGAVANGLAANCISWRLARDYCRAQRVNGDLPSRAEWNALAAPRGGFVVRADTHEWSADEAGDDRYQVRGERGARGFAWASEAGEPGRRYISFRCVVRATRGE